MNFSFTTFTQEQFDALLSDRDESLRREARVLELAEGIQHENFALKAGLIHYDKAEVAAMLHCSTKMIERYEKSGKLIATRIGSKVLFSARSLMAFVEQYNVADVKLPESSNYPKRKRR